MCISKMETKLDPAAINVYKIGETDSLQESPIDFNMRFIKQITFPSVVWNNMEETPRLMKLTNSGHSVILSAKWFGPRPFISGGPLEDLFVFSQLHFHWGKTDNEGSEHTNSGLSAPMEAHAMFFKRSYKSQEEAMKHIDGIVVMGYLFNIRKEPNENMKAIIEALKEIDRPYTSKPIELSPLSRFITPFTDDYLLYWGKVVDSHRILWFIHRQPLTVSSEQVSHFRRIQGFNKSQMTENFRGTKPLNGRTVLMVNPGPDRTTPLIILPPEVEEVVVPVVPEINQSEKKKEPAEKKPKPASTTGARKSLKRKSIKKKSIKPNAKNVQTHFTTVEYTDDMRLPASFPKTLENKDNENAPNMSEAKQLYEVDEINEKLKEMFKLNEDISSGTLVGTKFEENEGNGRVQTLMNEILKIRNNHQKYPSLAQKFIQAALEQSIQVKRENTKRPRRVKSDTSVHIKSVSGCSGKGSKTALLPKAVEKGKEVFKRETSPPRARSDNHVKSRQENIMIMSIPKVNKCVPKIIRVEPAAVCVAKCALLRQTSPRRYGPIEKKMLKSSSKYQYPTRRRRLKKIHGPTKSADTPTVVQRYFGGEISSSCRSMSLEPINEIIQPVTPCPVIPERPTSDNQKKNPEVLIEQTTLKSEEKNNPPSPINTPKSPVDTPKSPVDTPKSPVNTPKSPVDTPKSLDNTPKSPVDTPKSPVDTPKSPVKPHLTPPSHTQSKKSHKLNTRQMKPIWKY